MDLSFDPLDEYEALLAAKLRGLSRESLLEFTKYTFPLFRENWHHRVMCQHLDALASGLITRLLIFAPPRHTKSELFSRRLPAYALGKNPNELIMSCSYGGDLATAMGRDVQRIMLDPTYHELFPKSRLQDSSAKVALVDKRVRSAGLFEIVGAKGTYLAAGVGGAITGKGFTLGLIDDPIKNQEEANSATYRERVWEWFTKTFYTRRQKGARIGITLTRWHDDDLAGRVIKELSQFEEGEPWTVLTLPAVADGELHPLDPRSPGEVLWPSEFNDVFMREQRRTLGERGFASLYQQRPSPAEGNIVKRTWWKYYDTIPEEFDAVASSWDLTCDDGEKSDYVAGVVVGVKGADAYILDLLNEQLTFTQGKRAIEAMKKKWPAATATYVEKAANGFATLDSMKRTMSGMIGVQAKGSKEDRVNACSPLIEAGNLWLPTSAVAPWAGKIVEQFAAFPKGDHDDIVDAITQAIIKMLIRKRATDFLPVGTRQTNVWSM